MLRLITSFNEALYKQYGNQFIDSWLSHAGEGVSLTVFCEGGTTWINSAHERSTIQFVALESKALAHFHNVFGTFIQARGGQVVADKQKPNLYSFQYNYQFDAIRFSFKAFAFHQLLQMETQDQSHVGWIDADVICRRNFCFTDLLPVIPSEDCLASYLGRSSFPPGRPHSECGFLVYNLNQAASLQFIEDFVDMYISGSIFLLSAWHDCAAFDATREKYEDAGHRFLNISGEFHDEEHPFIKSHLGLFFDHLKGPARKAKGSSFDNL